MDVKEIEKYLHDNIPLAVAMGVGVKSVDAFGVRLAVPLEPNRNHRDHLFGGSGSAVMILAGWIAVFTGLREAGLDAEIVVQDSTVEFQIPVTADFEVVCPRPVEEEWTRFVETLRKRGRSRIELGALIECHDSPAVRFIGRYVAIRGE